MKIDERLNPEIYIYNTELHQISVHQILIRLKHFAHIAY